MASPMDYVRNEIAKGRTIEDIMSEFKEGQKFLRQKAKEKEKAKKEAEHQKVLQEFEAKKEELEELVLDMFTTVTLPAVKATITIKLNSDGKPEDINIKAGKFTGRTGTGKAYEYSVNGIWYDSLKKAVIAAEDFVPGLKEKRIACENTRPWPYSLTNELLKAGNKGLVRVNRRLKTKDNLTINENHNEQPTAKIIAI